MKKLYSLFRNGIGNNYFVRFYFEGYKRRHPDLHKNFKIISAAYLIWLAIKFRLFGYDPRIHLKYPETETVSHPDYEKLRSILKKKSMICFDAELLLHRRVSQIGWLWDAAGAKLGIADYKNMRRMAAEVADRRKGEGIACLADVCKIVSEWSGKDAEAIYHAESELEEKLCFADPYYVSMISSLQNEGKRVFVYCESRLPSLFWKKLLQNKGILCEKVYTAGECDRLWNDISADLSGNGICCLSTKERCVKAQKAGLKVKYICPVAEKLSVYRPLEQHSLAMSVYEAVVNEHLHVSETKRSALYQHGFVYGGILAYGYCSWLEKLVRDKGYDCIVFLARDAEIFYKIYSKYFGSVPGIYLCTSRMAAMKVGIRKYFNFFLDRMFASKADKQTKITVVQALEQAEVSALAEELPESLSGQTLLDTKTLPRVLEFLTERREKIFQIYERDRSAFQTWSSAFLQGKKRILIVDLGWRGTIFSLLSSFWKETDPLLECDGALLGVSESSLSESLTAFGNLKGYLYLDDRIRDNQLILTELLFSSVKATTIGYKKDRFGQCEPVFGEQENVSSSAINELNAGTEDFCRAYREAEQCFPKPFEISGTQAALPITMINANKRYNLKLYKAFRVCLDPNGKTLSVRDFLKEIYY